MTHTPSMPTPPAAAGRVPMARTLRAGFLAGLAAAVIEMLPVLPAQAGLGVTPARVFQSIAGGLLGAATYKGGAATAALGVALHLFIAVAAALIYAMAGARWPVLLRRPVVCGLVYGVLAYLVMTLVIVPLSAVPYKTTFNPALMALSTAIHMVAFGLPIAWICARLLRPAR